MIHLYKLLLKCLVRFHVTVDSSNDLTDGLDEVEEPFEAGASLDSILIDSGIETDSLKNNPDTIDIFSNLDDIPSL